MNPSRSVLRAAGLRGPWAVATTAAPCRHFSASRSFAYNAYSLPQNTVSRAPSGATAPPTNDGSAIPDPSITNPNKDSLPRVHETRPPLNEKVTPARPAPASPTTSTAAASSSPPASSAEPQKFKPTTADSAATPPASTAKAPTSAPRPRSQLRTPRKAAMKLTPTAVDRLRSLLDSPEPKLIKVGVRNRGCSGLSYHLEYVDKPGKFDEMVEQDGVQVVIDSKALFSIIGSEMDWAEDKLNQRFTFRNPNIKEECGCGESFMVS